MGPIFLRGISETMQMDGKFEGFPLNSALIWIGVIFHDPPWN